MDRRKKDRLINIIWFGCIMLIALLLIGASVAKGSGQAYTEREIIVRQGDTLWGYWQEYGTGRYDKWLYEVKQINGMEQSGLTVGQAVKILEVK